MTLEGTNTYVVGAGPAYVIDPGPADEAHIEAVRAAGEERGGIAGVLLTHSHADHSAGVPMLGAPLLFGEVGAGDETSGEPGAERGLERPRRVDPGRVGPFEVLPTPGHATDHVCFLLGRVGFCGDLVLGHGLELRPARRRLAGRLPRLPGAPARARPGAALPRPRPLDRGPGGEDRRVPRAPPDARAQAAGRAGEGGAIAGAAAGPGLGRRARELRPAAAVVMRAHLEKLEAEGRLPPGLARLSVRRSRATAARRAECLELATVSAGGLAKRFGLAGAAFTALAGTTAAGLWHQLFRRPLPRVKGSLRLNGLEQAVEIGRDRWGVPHIRAKTRQRRVGCGRALVGALGALLASACGSSFVPPDGGSLAAYLDSLERLRALDLELLCPGHGPWIDRSGGEDRRVPRAPADARAQAARRARGRRALAGAAARRGLGRRARELLRPAAAVVMQAHLEKLEAEGRLPQRTSRD